MASSINVSSAPVRAGAAQPQQGYQQRSAPQAPSSNPAPAPPKEETIWRRIGGSCETQSGVNFKVGETVLYHSASQGGDIRTEVIKLEGQRFQLQCKAGQWLTASDCKGRLKKTDGSPPFKEISAAGSESKVSIMKIVEHSDYLKTEFPQLVQKFSEVAVKGEVSWKDFRNLYNGAAPRNAKADSGASASAERKQFSRDELQKMFRTLDKDNTGKITLTNLIQSKDLVEREVPEMLTKWSDIDANDDGVVSWDEFLEYFVNVEDWLELRLSKIVGLNALKDKIRTFYRGVMLDRTRQKQGQKVATDQGETKYHMIFQGNPGTGKTTIGRLVAGLLYRIGIIPTESMVEVQRGNLVAEYTGQTAPKTQKVIESAIGGILFVDEAYQLSRGQKDSFGVEALEALMAVMNEPPDKSPIMVFAGYTAEMEDFMQANAGLYRRITYTFDFTDYTSLELAQILERLVERKGFKLKDSRETLAKIIESNTSPSTRAMMNGGTCERIFDYGKQELDKRCSVSTPSVELTAPDLTSACKLIKPPPAANLKPGSRIEYHSTSLKQWVPAVVEGFDSQSGAYRICLLRKEDERNGIQREQIRLR